MSVWSDGEDVNAVALNVDVKNSLTLKNTGQCLLIQPSTDPAAGTKLLEIKNDAGTSKFSVDLEGDPVVGGNLTISDGYIDALRSSGTCINVRKPTDSNPRITLSSSGAINFGDGVLASVPVAAQFGKTTHTYDAYHLVVGLSTGQAVQDAIGIMLEDTHTGQKSWSITTKDEHLLFIQESDGKRIIDIESYPSGGKARLGLFHTADDSLKVRLGIGTSGQYGYIMLYDQGAAGLKYAYISGGAWVISDNEPT